LLLGLLYAKKDLAANDILYYNPAYAIRLSAKNFGFEDNKK